MARRSLLTSTLAIGGTILVWLPLVAPALFTILAYATSRLLRFDYLMPAELYLVVLAGGLCLLWASVRARSRTKAVGWSFGLTVATLVAGQAVAVFSGLASGAAEPSGWPFTLVMLLIAGYILSVAGLGITGLLLVRDLPRGRLESSPDD